MKESKKEEKRTLALRTQNFADVSRKYHYSPQKKLNITLKKNKIGGNALKNASQGVGFTLTLLLCLNY